jgi:hypothetical protein
MVAVKNLSERNVPVRGPDGKVRHVLPGDVFPEWAEVSNPNVIGDQLMDDETRAARFAQELAELKAKHGYTDDTPDEEVGPGDADSPPGEGRPPARAGRGSSVEAWADYALDHNVEISDNQSRDEIIAACEKAGIPV